MQNDFIERYKMKKQTIQIKLVLTLTLAFLCTIFFAGYKINAAKIKVDQWLLTKKKTAISCSLYRAYNKSDKKFNDHGSINYKDPADKNNGNGCTHHQGAYSLCETTNSKRRVFKIHTC